MSRKILITGGAGFIGSNLALALQRKYSNDKITVIDDFSSGNFKNLEGFKGDVIAADLSFFSFENQSFDIIFHEAAITDTTVCDQKTMMEKNTEVFRKILNYSLKTNAKLIYASSAATYGNTKPPNKVGENETPANIYGFSKLICDNITRRTLEQNPNTKIIGLRYFNVYGPKENFKGKMASMIWQLHNQIKDGKSPRLFKYGEQKRDFIYIKDVVDANILSIDGQSGIYNVGTGKAENFNKIVEELNKNLGTQKKPEYFDNPYSFYQDYTEADIILTTKKLKYSPKYDLKKGIKDYIDSISK